MICLAIIFRHSLLSTSKQIINIEDFADALEF